MNSDDLEASYQKEYEPGNDPTTGRSASTRAPDLASCTHPLSQVKTASDKIVSFDGPADPLRPLNWPVKKKIITTVLYGMTTAGATWLSSVYTAAESSISKEFHVGEEVSTLGITLFLFGCVPPLIYLDDSGLIEISFGLGPLLWAPMSEAYGRKLAVLPPFFVASCFTFGTATAKDIQTILITRFFAGFFSAAPVSNTGGMAPNIRICTRATH